MTLTAEQYYRLVGIAAPSEHQLKTWSHLSRGERVILQAPTGSGKTEAAVLPYLACHGQELPSRLLYTLPLRSVTGQVCERIVEYSQVLPTEQSLAVRVQHGERPESALFAADAVVATIDQIISSFACAPLTLPVRHGNIPAGGVLSSFVVFDEVHLLDPQLALQAMRIICCRLRRLGMPFVIMTATLPHDLITAMADEFDAKIVSSNNEFVNRHVEISFTPAILDSSLISSFFDTSLERILVICNTVDRAIRLYRAIQPSAMQAGYECQLLHSRFLPEHRQQKEEWTRNRFGRCRTAAKAILIATQVVEVGLDLSADLLVSEIAPIDALIQRIGRVARWGGEGRVVIADIPSSAPYEKQLLDKTRQTLANMGNWSFSWSSAQFMIDEILNEHLLSVWNHHASVQKVIFQLNQAAFKGSRKVAASAIRAQDRVQVSVIDTAYEIASAKLLRLPWFNISVSTARQWIERSRKCGCLVQRVTVDENKVDDARPTVAREKLHDYNLRFGDLLLFDSTIVSYDPELGLAEGIEGYGFQPRDRTERQRAEKQYYRETWYEHIRKVVVTLRELLHQDRHSVEGLARLLKSSVTNVEQAALLTAVLHDVGKLTREWQSAAGVGISASATELLAHTGEKSAVLPPHATISAYCCWDALQATTFPKPLKFAIAYAIAHHHSVRAKEVPRYSLHPTWQEAVSTMLFEVGLDKIVQLEHFITKQESSTSLRDRIPRFDWPDYDAYVMLARWLRLADWLATGGSDAVRDYEDWFGYL